MKQQRSQRTFYAHLDATSPPNEVAKRAIDGCVDNFLAVTGMEDKIKGIQAYDLYDAVTSIQNHLSYDMFGNVLIRSDSMAIADENAFILLCDKFCDLHHILSFHITTDLLTERQKDLQDRMSRLCEMSVEIYEVSEKLVDIDYDKYENRWEKVAEIEAPYQALFSETVEKFG